MIEHTKYTFWGILFVIAMCLIGQKANALTGPETQDLIERMAADKKTFIIKYEADWCGYCKIMTPVVNKVATKEGFFVLNVDIDRCFKPKNLFGVPALDIYI